MIDPAKDLDGISPVNIAKVFSGDTSVLRRVRRRQWYAC